MVTGFADAGLPPRTSVCIRPVIFQEGDTTARPSSCVAIADYAQAGQVIVSQEVVDHRRRAVEFSDVGAVELKGVPGARRLFAAARV